MDFHSNAPGEDDLSLRFKSFTLTDEEQGPTILSHVDVVDSLAECQTSLLGKVISQKAPNLVGLRNTMEKVWGNPKNFRVLAVGDGIFQFIFPSELDATRVLRGKPWFFNNNFLNLERWQPNKALKDYCFDFTPMWVQAWGLPLQFLSKDVGVKLGMRFGDVDDVVIPQSWSREGRFLRIRTVLNVTQPLKRGCMIRLSEEKPIWIEFRYEKLPAFCRYCGRVGHEFLNCIKRFLDLEDEVVLSAQYGEWLRASPATQPGRRPGGSGSVETQRAGIPLSESEDSSAENQGRDSRAGISNFCSNRKGRVNTSDSVAEDSAHKEMLSEAYLAERSVDVNPNLKPKLRWDQLTPDLEQIIKDFPYRGPRPTAQSSPLTPVTKSSNIPNLSPHCDNFSLNLAQHPPPTAHSPNHILTQPITPVSLTKSCPENPLLTLPSPYPSALTIAKSPHSPLLQNQIPNVPLLSATIPSSSHDTLPPDIQVP